MIVFLRSIHASVDSRLTRYVHALDAVGKDSMILHWARGGNAKLASDRVKSHTFFLKAGLGGGWKNAIGLIQWMYWCFATLVRNRRMIRVVHAVDLDTALPALLFSTLFRKKFVFDIYDSYGDARNMSGIARKVVDALEGFAALRAHVVILPDVCRLEQVPAGIKDVRIVENVPFVSRTPDGTRLSASTDRIKLAYVGILEAEHRGLEDLMSAVSLYPGKVELHIAGFGPLAGSCKEKMREHGNIRFYGAVTPDKAIQLMNECDVVIGMYYRTKSHHLRATPNKYYEHLMLGKPLVTTIGTPPGSKIAADYSGWALEEGAASIEALIEQVTREECQALGANALKKWREQYSRYFETVLIQEYANRICQILP
jgi:glycosyltransferase involved in cell wall biosynthesis